MKSIGTLDAGPGIAMGVSTVRQFVTREDQAGLLAGLSSFTPGSVEVEMTYDEGIYMLDGEIEIESGGKTHLVRSGDFFWMSKGVVVVYHAKTPCRFLYVIPASAEAGA